MSETYLASIAKERYHFLVFNFLNKVLKGFTKLRNCSGISKYWSEWSPRKHVVLPNLKTDILNVEACAYRCHSKNPVVEINSD